MIPNQLNVSKLIPEFDSILGIKSIFRMENNQLSAVFVVLLLLVFSGFLLTSIVAFIASSSNIKWVNNLLKNKTTKTIVKNRQNLIEKAKHTTNTGGHIWSEFDETLVEVERNGIINLYNTIDANHFFNESTLAAGITESRMLAAVPGFLTALGVLGTFVGLQLGLSNLDVGPEVATNDLRTGISVVISGAKVAFMTSVWGVALSVVFNIIEKILEKKTRSRIHKLQTRVDSIFPRLNAENQLQQIVSDGQQSRQTLQGLAEKIGEKMQESLLGATDGIRAGLESALEKIMAPAINKLVDETSDGNQKALTNLVEQFLSRFGDLGNTQREAMDNASQKVSNALGSFNSSIDSFLDKLEASKSNSEDQDQYRQEVFLEQTKEMKASTGVLLSRIESGLESQLATSSSLIEQGKFLQKSIDSSVQANFEASTNLKASATELNSAAQKMGVFGTHIKDAGDNISGAVSNAVERTSELALQNINASEMMEKNTHKFMQAIELLQSLISSADSSFGKMREHQNEFLSEQKSNVDDLNNHMTELLTDYEKQVKSQTDRHLNDWAKHTTNYAAQMNRAVQALSNVVDDIEGKLGK